MIPKDFNKEKLLSLYHQMWLIRYFDEKVDEFFARGMIHGTTHLCVGQEATAAGACAVLQEQDKITSTHRGHGHCIAKGADASRMMAELFAKETGYCRGKGGSMHIADVEKGNLGANGIVGGGIPIAVGAGLTAKMKKQDYVVLCFFGDGAANEGSFHEAINLASIWQLPVIFFCENNQYGMSGSVKEMVNIEHLGDRAGSYGIPGKVIEGNDLFAVIEATKEAADRARNGGGPTLIEAKTYRWKGHSKSDAKKYRTKEEEKMWRKQKDPIQKYADELLAHQLVDQATLDQLQAKAKQEIEAAVKFAEESPEPRAESLMEDVYA